MTLMPRAHQDLAWALKQQAKRVGEQSPTVRGSDWQMATVTAVNGDGTIAVDGIPAARCLEGYAQPTDGDIVLITRSSSGNWVAWGRLAESAFTVGETVVARKTANTSRASTTTPTADPHLTIAVAPGTYQVDSLVLYQAAETADLRLGWTTPSGTSGAWWPGGSDSGNTTFAATTRWGARNEVDSTLPVAGVGAGNIMACRPVGTLIVTSAGSVALAWAQQASSTTATILHVDSWLQLRRIA